jgi:glycosyltransferase involved in cell wall biosynthesis
MASLAVIILARNEELHLARALRHVAPVASEIFIIDSYSTDNTVEIARRHGATILQHEFINYAKQFEWALENAPVTADWIMRLDADEIVEADLAAEIEAKLATLPPDITGINLKRKHIFQGRWIKHGGRYPLVLLRMWRRGKARIEDRWMDEHMVLCEGQAVTFDGGFADHNLNDLSFFIDKHNKYATREAIDVVNQRQRLFARDLSLNAHATSFQTATKRFIKEQLYNRIPFEISTLAYFLYRYIVQFGFLDGRAGLVYHFLQGYWYRFLVGTKVRELEYALADLKGERALQELSRLTGFKVASTVRQ